MIVSLTLGFGLLAVRLAFLQLVRGDVYTAEARANAYREVSLPAPRGRILDRNGTVLAQSRLVPCAAVIYPGEEAMRRRLGRVSLAIGVPPHRILTALRRNADRLFAPVVVARGLSPAAATTIAERTLEWPELRLVWEPVRDYPLGPAASHLLGYVAEVSPEDVASYPDLYRPGDLRGLTGVEAACDWLLRGEPETVTYEVTAAGWPGKAVAATPGRPGLDVRLTIDAGLQATAFEALGQAMFKARRDSAGSWAATGGAVVALDPSTGAVLALVSRPSFDPAAFSPAFGGPPAEALTRDPLTPLLNRATSGLYAPGSTFKLVTAVAAQEEGVVGETEAVWDGGVHPFVPKKCWLSGGHGWVRLKQAIEWSCNVYFYEMGLRLGLDRLARWAGRLGLGRPTGLDLLAAHGRFGPGRTGPRSGGEPAGTVASAAWKAANFPDDPTVWPAEVMDAAIGQGGTTCTPLQMAVLTAALANGGTLWQPYVVETALDEAGGEVARACPRAAGRVAISEATLRAVRQAMKGVAMDPGVGGYPGTAAWVFGPEFEAAWGVEIAGKTGTAEHGRGAGQAEDAWFVGWAPYDDPGLVVAVVVEQGGSGSRTAAPVARAVIEAWLEEAEQPQDRHP